MLYKTRGIVLHSIPYSDKYSIIYMYTEAFGRVSYLVTRTRGKKSNISRLESLHSNVSPRLATVEDYARALGYSVKIEFEPRIH